MKTIIAALFGSAALLVESTSLGQVPLARLTSSTQGLTDRFGYSVATDGVSVLVGTGKGSAYLFDPFANQQLAQFIVSDPRFNTSVAIEGTTAVVGSVSGAHVYNFSNLSNITSSRLLPSDATGLGFGVAVDLSGDVIIVGNNSDNRAGSFTGAAYLFDRSTGVQFAKLTANDGKALDNFGLSVGLDGNRAVVGAVNASNALGVNRGAVYLYDANFGSIPNRQLGKFTVPPESPYPSESFGAGVDISGEWVVTGQSTGRSYIWPTSGTPAPIPGSGELQITGHGVSIAGAYAMVGFHSTNRAVVFNSDGTPFGYIRSPKGMPTEFGWSVAVQGNLVVVGAPDESGGGAAYVYRLSDLTVPEPAAMGLLAESWLLLVALRRGRFTQIVLSPLRP